MMDTKLEVKAVFTCINKYRTKYVKTLNKLITKSELWQATMFVSHTTWGCCVIVAHFEGAKMEDQEVASTPAAKLRILECGFWCITQHTYILRFIGLMQDVKRVLHHTTGWTCSLMWSHWPADKNKTEIIVVLPVAVVTHCHAALSADMTSIGYSGSAWKELIAQFDSNPKY